MVDRRWVIRRSRLRYSRPVARRVIFALLMVLAAMACTSDPPAKGGIFGDRPIDPPEENDSSVRDGGKDSPTDVGTDRADTSTPPKDAADEE
jgi:hypothetical protein